MQLKNILIIAGVGATLGGVGYLYFKKKKPIVSETQIKTLNENTISDIESELFSPETKPEKVSGSTLGATFSNAQTIVQNEKVTAQESSLVVSQLLDMVQQQQAEAIYKKLQSNVKQDNIHRTSGYKGEPKFEITNDVLIGQLKNLGYELQGLNLWQGRTERILNLGTLKKIGV